MIVYLSESLLYLFTLIRVLFFNTLLYKCETLSVIGRGYQSGRGGLIRSVYRDVYIGNEK